MEIAIGSFSRAMNRAGAKQSIEEEQPMFLLGSLMCMMFMTLVALIWNAMDKAKRHYLMKEAEVHLKLMFDLYNVQEDAGRFWLHEHLWGARD